MARQTRYPRYEGSTVVYSALGRLHGPAITPNAPRKTSDFTKNPWYTRRHKFLSSNRLQGIKHANLSITQIKEKLINKLKLLFSPEEWQMHLISRICQGYDSILCAGTGKSLIFEGLAAFGGKSEG